MWCVVVWLAHAARGRKKILPAPVSTCGPRRHNRPVPRNDQDEERQRLFARNLRAARERAGLTQASMATKLGMEDEVYARYERARMWPSLDRLGRICDVLDCTSDALLGTDQPPPPPARAPAPAPDEDSPDVRRLLRRLRKARPKTLRLVKQMIDELDKCARPAPGGDDDATADAASGDETEAASAPADDAAASSGDATTVAAGTHPGNDGDAAAGGVPGDDGGTGEP
jgi:DNA-binding XRE family transcriptional regulator